MADESEWDTSSGLPLAGGVLGDIITASFGPNNEITPGANFLRVTVTPYNTETGEAMEDRDNNYSCGDPKLWEPKERGAVLVKTREGIKMSEQSTFGRLMNAVSGKGFTSMDGVHHAGLDVVGEGEGRLNGSPFRAETWLGTRWAWDIFEFPNTKSKSGVSKVALPVEFHGYVDVDGEADGGEADESESAEDVPTLAPAPAKAVAKNATAPASAPAKAPAKKATAPAKKAAAKKSANISAELRETLTQLAYECEDHDDFAARAFDIEDVANGDADVQNAVLNAGPASIFAIAKAAQAAEDEEGDADAGDAEEGEGEG